jgi:hypothetical protein
MVKYFSKTPSFYLALCLIISLTASAVSCGGSKGSGRNSKKIKRGKPIPCPMKDC